VVAAAPAVEGRRLQATGFANVGPARSALKRLSPVVGSLKPFHPHATVRYTAPMKYFHLAALVLTLGSLVHAQERKVPSDSERVSIPGCSRNRTFIVAERAEGEPVRSDVAPGRRFRMSGPKKLLGEIKGHEGTMIEITGLARKQDIHGPGGISVLGGRVRIGGAMPRAGSVDPAQDPSYNEAVLDVESWRPLGASCPAR
jgi:hypothetical protein